MLISQCVLVDVLPWQSANQFRLNLKISYLRKEKRLYRKLMPILNDPTLPKRHTLIADAATGVEDFYFREQIQTVIKPHFYSLLCQFLMKIIPMTVNT